MYYFRNKVFIPIRILLVFNTALYIVYKCADASWPAFYIAFEES